MLKLTKDNRIISLVLDLFKEHLELRDYDLKDCGTAKFDLLAIDINEAFKSVSAKQKNGDFISGKSIGLLLEHGAKEKTTTHNKLAAYWLHTKYPKEWTIEHILSGFKISAPKKSFWIAYLKHYDQINPLASLKKSVESAIALDSKIEVNIDHENSTQVTITEEDIVQDLVAFNNKSDVKLIDENIQPARQKYLTLLQELSDKQFLIVIEGVTGSGKTELIKAFIRKNNTKFSHVVYPTIATGYSFDMLLNDQEKLKLEDQSISSGAKVDKLIDKLWENDILLVLDDFENTDEASFKTFLESAALVKRGLRVLISHNEKFKLLYKRPKDIIHVKNYTLNELATLCESQSIPIDKGSLQLLLNKTDGIPFVVDFFIEVAKSSYFGIPEKIQKLNQQPEYQEWVESIFRYLFLEQKKLLTALSLIKGYFELKDVFAIAALIGVSDSKAVFESLQDKFFFIKQDDTDDLHFRVLQPFFEYYEALPATTEIKQIHGSLATYFWPENNFETKKDYDRKDLELIIKSIFHYQRQGIFRSSIYYFRNCLKYLKRYGMYHTLQEITRFEIQHNNNSNSWIKFEYVHASFILGRMDAAYRMIIAITIEHLDKPELGSKFKLESFDTIVAKTIKYLQLYSEILEQLGYADLGLSLLLDTVSVFDITSYDWRIRSHAASIISWLYFKNDDIKKSINITNDLLRDMDISVRGDAIAYIRLGIFYMKNSNLEPAKKHLEKALELLLSETHKDQRALAWCTLYLSKCFYELNDHKNACVHLVNCLNTSHTLDLFDKDYLDLLPSFKKYNLDIKVSTILDEEIVRVTERNTTHCTGIKESQIKHNLEKVRSLLADRIVKDFDYHTLFKPIDHTPKPIGSPASRSVINRAKKQNPEGIIEMMFEKNVDIKKIFGCHFYNKLITECLKYIIDKKKIIERYIAPHLGFLLENSTDKIKLHYARALEYAHDTKNSLLLLNAIAPQGRRFEFNIITANCYKYADFELSYEYYKRAEALTFNDDAKKGRVYNNISQLIFNKKMTGQYEEAKEMCEQARECWKTDRVKSLYPITTRILIEIEESDLESVVANTKKIMDKFNIVDMKALRIFEKVKDNIKRDKLIFSIKKDQAL